MRSLFLLLLSFIFLFAAKAQEVEQRVINGDIVDASDPAGNIPTLVFFPGIIGCTNFILNSEWLFIEPACLFEQTIEIGSPILVYYTNSTGSLVNTANTTVAEIFVHPDFFQTNRPYLLFGRVAGKGFAMVRLAEPMSTCEDGMNCTANNPDVPMNAYVAYDETSSRFNKRDLTLLGYGSNGKDPNLEINLYQGLVEGVTSGSAYGGSFWRMRWGPFKGSSARGCSGDLGSPLLTQIGSGAETGYGVVGSYNGRFGACYRRFGLQWAFRFVEESADAISENVASSGGTCTKEEIGGVKTIRCSNPE